MREPLIDREAEVRELRALLRAPGPRLALLYGRRRVGKTFLLNRVWPGRRTFYYTAADTTQTLNRRQLVEDAGRWLGRSLGPEDYPTWRTVFRLLLDLGAPEPTVVVLDEFQYLAEDAAGLAGVTSELNAVWEERRPRRPFVLALSGSAVRVLEALDAGGAPLHGRLNWKHQLKPFDYLDAARMASFPTLRERALAYGIYGGTPQYLATIAPADSLAENVARQVLSPRGPVRMQVETALDQERGLREVAKYRGIVRAIADGRTSLNEIAQGSGLSADTGLRTKLDTLMALGYVERRRNLGAPRNAPYHYRLADPAFRFYYGVVSRLQAELERSDPLRVWGAHVEGSLDAYMGLAFESLAEQAYYRLAPRRGLPMVRQWARWEGTDRWGKQLEVDVAALLADGRVLTGCVKWNRRPLGPHVHFSHLDAVDRLAASGIAWAHRAREPSAPILYVAAGGFSEAFAAAAGESGRDVILWTLDDLYGARHRRRRARTTGDKS